MMRPLLAALLVATLLVLGGSGSLVRADRAGYDDTTALNMVMASAIAYCPQSQVSNWNCKPCHRLPMERGTVEYVYDSKYNVAAFVGLVNMKVLGFDQLAQIYPGQNLTAMDWESQRAVLVSFRGSQGLKDWINNLKFSKVDLSPVIGGPCPGCKVHLGFQQDYTNLRVRITNKVRSLVNSNSGVSHIIVTGHSLGGAMANLASWDMLVNQWAEAEHPEQVSAFANTPILLYTFGQPRVGNEAFSSRLRQSVKHTWRVVNKADIVPHLPPHSFGFQHIGVEVWFASKTSGQKCNWQTMCALCAEHGEDKKCSNSLVPFTNIPDHMEYLATPLTSMC